MNILVKQAKVYDKNSPWHLKKVDILIKRSKIVEIGRKIEDASAKIISRKGLCVSPGWLDIGTNITDPGNEDLDDLQSISDSAAAGGFTSLAVFPNTDPVMDSKGSITSLKHHSDGMIVDFYPIGALTMGNKGMDISEMHDLQAAGAIAFSDGKKSLQHAGVMQRALRYISNMNTTVINRPEDKTLSEAGIMNESKENSFLGLKGIPSLAEELALNRDIKLCEYTESSLMAHLLSSKESVKMVKKARQSGVDVKASVSFHNLVATDQSLREFDPMHKVNPPLREKKDANALVRALLDDSIDCIVSNHKQADVEDKRKAFLYAAFGSLGLEQMFAVLNTKLEEKLPLEVLVDKLSAGPRQALGLKEVTLAENQNANLTLFDPAFKWEFNKTDIKSKSSNAVFLGEELKGKVLAVINNGQISKNEKL